MSSHIWPRWQACLAPNPLSLGWHQQRARLFSVLAKACRLVVRTKPMPPKTGRDTGADRGSCLGWEQLAAHMRRQLRGRSRAALGIEPGTSRTRSENHATRPSSLLGSIEQPLGPMVETCPAPNPWGPWVASGVSSISAGSIDGGLQLCNAR